MHQGAIFLTLFLSLATSWAMPRALPGGKLPDDKRLAQLKDLNGYFPFRPPVSGKEWEARSEKIRHRLKVAVGLYPEPERTPLNAVIHGRVEGDGFSVEKVYLESVPGFYLTGNLYRPLAAGAIRRPGILCPHGHWQDGRFHDAGEANIKKQIEQGAEEFLETGRNPIQARCVGLARMGCVVFQYDMIGYCDNDQISYQLAHRFAEQRPGMIATRDWGLFSPQAESHLQSVMMLQTWNSIRAIDFMEALPDVDPERIAVTGASGGGTQTFIVSALDPRVKVSVPAVMVSTAMQGGCTCENASLLRVDEGNVAFAALFAPKPLCVTAADDWTKEMATKGFPELSKLYGILGVQENLMLHSRTEFGHNYNLPSRQAMYRWLNGHLGINAKNPGRERPHKRLHKEQLTVWNDKHPKPPGGERFERRLLAVLQADSAKKISASAEVARRGWEVVLNLSLANVGSEISTRKEQLKNKSESDVPDTPWNPVKPHRMEALTQQLKLQPDLSILAGGDNPKNDTYTIEVKTDIEHISAIRLEALMHPTMTGGGLARSNSGNFVLTGFEMQMLRPGSDKSVPLKIENSVATFEQGSLKISNSYDGNPKTGWAVHEGRIADREHQAVFRLKQPLKAGRGTVLKFILRHDSPHPNHNLGHFRLSVSKDGNAPLAVGKENNAEWELITKEEREGYLVMAGLVNNVSCKQQLPVVFLYPKENWNKRAVIWLDAEGKSGLFEGQEPRTEVKKLLAAGSAVCGVDLFMQGEFLADGKALSQTRRVKNPRESAAFTFGYNRSLFVHRVHDVLSLIRMIRNEHHRAEKIDLVGLKGAGHWAAAVNYLAGETLDRVAIEAAGFKFIKVMDIRHPDFLPGGAKYGDIEALLGLAKRPCWRVDDKGLPTWLQ